MDNKNFIPKYIFDKEYSTQWRREVDFLADKGINFVYAKKHDQYPITKYKYTKTPELFLALAEFYSQVRNEQTFKKIENLTKQAMPLEKGCIDINASELSEAEKKTVGFQNIEQEVENLIKDDTE